MHPILFKIGPLTVYSYGVMAATAFSVCVFLIWRNAPRFGVGREKLADLFIVILSSGIIGARVLHVLFNFRYYLADPVGIFMLARGGLAFQGGLILALISGIIYLKINKIHFWAVTDLFAPYIALGQAIGRVGCLLNGCCYGKFSVASRWAIIFPGETVPRFPVQLYSALSLLAIYMILRAMLEKNILKGNLILLYFMLQALQRFFISFLRGDLPVFFFGITIPQAICVVMFFAASGVLVFRLSHRKEQRQNG